MCNYRISAEMLDTYRQSLMDNGYVVVPTGLPAEMLSAVLDDILRHTGASLDRPESWYRPDIIRPKGGMAEMYHYQSMWDIRQHPSVYNIFSALHQNPRLWVSIDRVAFKPPVNSQFPDYDVPGFIHWDTDINRFPDIPLHLQGVIALQDADSDMGGFQCIPEIYKDLDHYIESYPGGKPLPRSPDVDGYPVTKVPLRAGEMVVWTTTLLHGNGRNIASVPRFAQYVTMNPIPADESDRKRGRDARVNSWLTNSPPVDEYGSFPGDPRRIEQERSDCALLTELGQHLLGLHSWSDDRDSRIWQ